MSDQNHFAIFIPPDPLVVRVVPSKVKFASPCTAFEPVTVTTVLLVDPVKLGPAPVNPLPSPTKLVAVTTPAMLTLSAFKCPSTSKSHLNLM